MGAPVGPRIKPYTVTDDKGEYTVYAGKHCSAPGCGVQLTSRNRHDNKLLCRDHRPKRSGRARAQRSEQPASPTSGEQKVLLCLSRWLRDPTARGANEELKAALVDFELKYRFTFFDLPKAPLEIPVEVPHFNNPEHRTTRQEFLSACDALGMQPRKTSNDPN